MRILFYSKSFYPKIKGGLEKYLFNLIIRLRDRHEIVLLTPKVNNIEINGVKIYLLHTLNLKILRAISEILSLFIFFPKIIRKEEIDVVSVFIPSTVGTLILMLSKIMRKKNILNIRGIKQKISLFRRIAGDIGLFFTKNIIINSKKFFARYSKQSFLPRSYLKSLNWIFIPNGVNTQFWSTKCENEKKIYDLVFVARFGRIIDLKIKGFEILYNSILKIDKDHNLKLRVLVIGDYSIRRIKRLIPNIDFSYFEFTGQLDDKQDVLKGLNSGKIFVLPSTLEGMPNSLMEAMAAGMSCIASNVGAVTELIDDNINGLIFPNKDSNKLTELILKLLNDPELRSKLGKNASEKMKREFSWQNSVKKVEFYYKFLQ